MNTSFDKKIAIALGFLLLLYLALRAYLIPLVHDEAATFFFYVYTGKFLPGNCGFDANNHFLNSALTYLFYKLFGSGELSLRLANLLFFPVFFIYWYKLSELITDRPIRWAFLLAALLAHNFIELFALSRGYGMSMALMTASIWYFVIGFKDKRNNFIMIGTLALLLALTANLSLLNTLVLLMGILLSYLLWYLKQLPKSNGYWYLPVLHREKIKNKRWVIFALLLCAVGAVLATIRLLAMKEHGSLYYGSGHGFWVVTVRSLKKMLLDTHHRLPSAFILSLVVFSGVGLLYLLLKSKEKKKLFFSPVFIFPILLFGNFLAAILLNKFFNVNFAEDRVGVYFYLFLLGSVCFVADNLAKQLTWKTFWPVTLPFLFFPIHFIMHVNFSHSSLWSFENIPSRFYDKVAAYIKPGEVPPTMAGYRLREITWAYRNFRNGGKAGMIYYTGFPEHKSDFQIAPAYKFGNWKKYYERIDYDPISDNSLLKRKHFLSKTLLMKIDDINTKSVTAVEFLNFHLGKADTLVGKDLYFDIGLTLKSWTLPFNAWIVIVVNDKEGKNLSYERIPLNWLKRNWDGSDKNFKNGIQLFSVPPNADKLLCYLWNIDKAPFRISNGSYRVYSLR